MIKNNPKILIPNFFTVLNIFVGLISIFYSLQGDFINAGWLILLATVMDKLDGTAARFFNASSLFGIEFDSFSDFISFGFAPAILVFSYFNMQTIPEDYLNGSNFYVVAASAVYVVFCAIRLAKYNVNQSDDKDYFYGLTTTMSGALIALYLIFAIDCEVDYISNHLLKTDFVAGMLLIHSFLLVTPFKYPKLKKPASKNLQTLFVILFFTLVGLVVTRQLPWVLYLLSVGYVIIGTLKTKKAFALVDEEPEECEKKEGPE
ncbi:MAG: CDP-alcohol phosphatidyltransferase family protein [bacterium]